MDAGRSRVTVTCAAPLAPPPDTLTPVAPSLMPWTSTGFPDAPDTPTMAALLTLHAKLTPVSALPLASRAVAVSDCRTPTATLTGFGAIVIAAALTVMTVVAGCEPAAAL